MASLSYDKVNKKWKVYWCSTTPDGKRVRGSRTFLSEQEAELYLSSASFSYNSVSQAVGLWKSHIRQFTSATQEHYIYCIDLFVSTLKTSNLSDIAEADILRFIRLSLESNITNRTVNSRLTVIKSFFRWASSVYGSRNPADKVKMLTESTVSNVISVEEYHRTLKAGSDLYRDRAIFLANTGLRASEFINLHCKEPSRKMENCSWPIHEGKALYVLGKGRKYRVVPLNQAAFEIMQRLTTSGYVFKSSNGGKLTRYALYHQFSKVSESSGVKKFGPHSLRHLFATQLLVSGAPISKVSKILGHSSIRTTEKIYAHWVPQNFYGVTDSLIL